MHGEAEKTEGRTGTMAHENKFKRFAILLIAGFLFTGAVYLMGSDSAHAEPPPAPCTPGVPDC